MYAHFIQKDLPDVVVDLVGKQMPPIIAGNDHSTMTGAPQTFSVRNNLQPGGESHGFAIELWVAPLSDSEAHLFTHDNVNVRWDGSLNFTVLVNGDPTTVSYTPDVMKAFHVVANYSGRSMALFVDGAWAAGVDFDSPNGSGWSAAQNATVGGAGAAIIDGVAVYNRDLPASVIYNHYLLGTTIPAITTNLSGLSAVIYSFHNQPRHLIARRAWPDWEPGAGTGVDIIDNAIYSEDGGSWQTFVPLTDYEVIQRGQIEWRSDGQVTVEISVNEGQTWTPVEDNGFIPGIAESAPMTLDIRVTLGAGATLKSLTVELYDSLEFDVDLIGGEATFSTPNVSLAAEPYNQLEYREDRGVRLDGSSVITINPVEDENAPMVHAVDMWVNGSGGLGLFWINDGPDDGYGFGFDWYWYGTLYVNGQQTNEIPQGEWVHILFKLPPTSGSMFIGEEFNGNIGSVTLFHEDVTGQEERIYRSYFGGQRAKVSESDGISIVEPADAWDLYSYTWTTIGA